MKAALISIGLLGIIVLGIPITRAQTTIGQNESFQAIDDTIVYVLGIDGRLWREFGTFDNAQKPRELVDGPGVAAFQAIDSEVVYVLGTDGRLWREFGTFNN